VGYEHCISDASPINHIHTAAPPFLLIHNLDDPWLSVEHFEMFVEALRKGGVTVDFIKVQ
jgi:dipeptidyl aminopeptidase/acylaminoacyl peptidase